MRNLLKVVVNTIVKIVLTGIFARISEGFDTKSGNQMTKLNSGLFSSIKQDWKTPSKVYEELDKEFHFDFDPCPPLKKITWEDHGLAIEWGQCNFVNPPYSDIKRWVCKAYREYLKGKTVVMLIPSRTDTHWWHDFVMRATEIRFIKGRLKFNDEKNSAPFPSAVIVFKN